MRSDTRRGVLRAFALAAWLCAAVPVTAAPPEGKPLAAFRIKTFDGRSLDAAQFAGKVVLLNFWATWCAPCREEMPAFERYYNAHKADGLEIVAVSVDEPEDAAKAREVMRAFSYPGGLASESDVDAFGRIRYMPSTFVIDRKGIVRKSAWHSTTTVDEKVLDSLLGPVLSGR